MTEEKEKNFRYMIEFPNGAKIYSNDEKLLCGIVEKCLHGMSGADPEPIIAGEKSYLMYRIKRYKIRVSKSSVEKVHRVLENQSEALSAPGIARQALECDINKLKAQTVRNALRVLEWQKKIQVIPLKRAHSILFTYKLLEP